MGFHPILVPLYLAAFVGNHYYCEWDMGRSSILCIRSFIGWYTGCGTGNGCCAQIGMMWFFRTLPVSVAEDFDL